MVTIIKNGEGKADVNLNIEFDQDAKNKIGGCIDCPIYAATVEIGTGLRDNYDVKTTIFCHCNLTDIEIDEQDISN